MMAADPLMAVQMNPGSAYGYSLKNAEFPNVSGNIFAGL